MAKAGAAAALAAAAAIPAAALARGTPAAAVSLSAADVTMAAVSIIAAAVIMPAALIAAAAKVAVAATTAAAGSDGAIAMHATRLAGMETVRAADTLVSATAFSVAADRQIHVTICAHSLNPLTYDKAGGDRSCVADGDVADRYADAAVS